MFCLRNYWPPAFTSGRAGAAVRRPVKFNSVVVCGARGPRQRYPRVWRTRKKIGTISKAQKLVQSVRFLYIYLLLVLVRSIYFCAFSF
uniref:Uncharacterized protein n=1 Tax=Arundo donax TaxID=35708 RepID=A0A0A9DLH5_ARUDO